MPTKYTYDISTDFPNGTVAPDVLTDQINESSISSSTLDYINLRITGVNNCDIWFDGALSGADVTTLDGIVAAHTGVPYLDIRAGEPGWNLRIEDRNLTDPPGSPVEGEYYIVATGGTGAWSGWDDSVAGWNGTTWQFQRPSEGLAAWVFDEDIVVVYVDATTKWASYGSPVGAVGSFGTDLNMVESTATSTTTSTSWQTKLTLNTSSLAGGTYLLEINYGWSADTTQYDFEGRVRQGATVLGQIHKQEAKDAAGSNGSTGTDQRYLAHRRYVLPLTAGSYTYTLQWRTSVSGNEASVWDAYMTLWRLS